MTVKNKQVRLLMKFLTEGKTFELASAKSDMNEKTARKYRDLEKLPSECKKERLWETRKNPFEEIWDEIEIFLENNKNIEAKTIFEFLQRKYPGKFQEGQIRTLQRKVKKWKIKKGPKKEVYFLQKHKPGFIGQLDFTNMNKIGITIQHQKFEHLLCHFVLTFSNWEFAKICFSENYESLSDGLQRALFNLGKAPKEIQTDRLSSAVKNSSSKKEFTDRYAALLRYYKIKGRKTQPYSPHENGDIEQSHYRLKKAIEQALILRGNKNFDSIEEYQEFLKSLIKQRNLSRQKKVQEEMNYMLDLPTESFKDFKKINITVGKSSTIRVSQNTYSVPSRLIGEKIDIHIHSDKLELFYGQQKIDSIPRIIGKNKHKINYHHIIHSLVKKPGAFESYRYKTDLFPNSFFRMAYDSLGEKKYLLLLLFAHEEGEDKVTEILKFLIQKEKTIELISIKKLASQKIEIIPEDTIKMIDLKEYDNLLKECFYD
jgi:hypothetical protein